MEEGGIGTSLVAPEQGIGSILPSRQRVDTPHAVDRLALGGELVAGGHEVVLGDIQAPEMDRAGGREAAGLVEEAQFEAVALRPLEAGHLAFDEDRLGDLLALDRNRDHLGWRRGLDQGRGGPLEGLEHGRLLLLQPPSQEEQGGEASEREPRAHGEDNGAVSSKFMIATTEMLGLR